MKQPNKITIGMEEVFVQIDKEVTCQIDVSESEISISIGEDPLLWMPDCFLNLNQPHVAQAVTEELAQRDSDEGSN